MRERLVIAARALFVANGYAATTTPALVEAAGVTRGAMYHHFADKKALFDAVVEAEAAQVAWLIEDADPPSSSSMDRLMTGACAYIDAMADPERARLLLLDAPAVLGLGRLREIENGYGDEALRIGLAEAVQEGELVDVPLDALFVILSAAFERAALSISQGMDRAAIEAALLAILNGLIRHPDR